MKNLLIVYHSQSGTNARLMQAAYDGALQESEVETRLLRASEANTEDLLWADAVIFGSPENFGYLSGGLTDFLARTFYPYQHHAPNRNLAYALVVGTGNDGSGAIRQLQRIVRGYPMREAAEAIIVRGEIQAADLLRCEELGLTMAAGLALGIF
ncbi:MAG: flavodoxin [Verrucomicrobiaceae bacterium]|nr:flavodoxin [Verrucomicrobiaceae bacterium]